jgi:hypothetical protein
MKKLSLAVALVLLVLGYRAESQEALRAQLLWYGLYTSGELRTVDDPNSPTGKSHFSNSVKGPPANSDRIEILANGPTQFGVGSRLTGVSNGTRVRTIHVIRFPGKGVPGKDGRLLETSTLPGEDTVGQDVHIGWRMNGLEPKEYEGEWTFQVWSEQRLLLERRFTVYRK